MLHFVLGRNGSGKTEYLRNIIAQNLLDETAECILIVPEQFSFESERAILKSVGAKNMLRADVLSFTRLAYRVQEYLGIENKPAIDDGVRSILMSLTLEGLTEKLEYFKKYVGRPQLLKQLLTFVTELKQCDIDPKELTYAANQLENGTLKTKLGELELISSLYNATVSQTYSDDLDLLTYTANQIPETDFFAGKIVCVDAFSGFTKQERNVLEQIMRQSKDMYISLCMDDFHAEDGSFSVFENVRSEFIKLKACAERQSVPIKKPIFLPVQLEKKPDDLNFLEKNLFSSIQEKYEKKEEHILLSAAGNKTDECDFVACEIKRLMREENIRCREIAVVERSQDTYEKELRESFKKYGVPFFEDKRQPIANQPIIIFVECLLKLITESLSTENLMRYLKTNLTEFSEEEISELENYAILWKVDGKKWRDDFTWNPDGLGIEFNETSLALLQRLNDIRKRLIAPILSFKKVFEESNGIEKSTLIYNYIEKSKAKENLISYALGLNQNGKRALAEEQDQVYEALMHMLDRMASAVGERVISSKRYTELFFILLSNMDLGRIPQGIDEVMLGSADRMRISLCKVVFILGANTSVFPLDPPTDGILNDRERKILESFGVELTETAEFKAIDERFIAYHAISGATEKLYVSYTLSDYKGQQMFPSEIVAQLTSIFPDIHTNDISLPDNFQKIESYASAFDELAKIYTDNTPTSETLKAYFANKNEYTSRLNALKKIHQNIAIQFQNPKIAMHLFGKDMFVSASRCETYYKCPFEYFCKFGLKAKPRQVAELDPAQSGTVIHFVLETVLKHYNREKLQTLSKVELRNVVHNALSEYIEVSMGGIVDKSKRFLYLYNRLEDTLVEVLERIRDEFKVCDFSPSDFELKIDKDAEIPAYVVPLKNGGSIQIRGSVDRVDTMIKDGKTYLRVVDYKSGGKKFALSDIFSGLNMQMIIYLFAICSGGQKKYGDIIPSGVLYMPAKQGSEKLGRNASEEEIKLEKQKTVKFNGIISNNTNAVLGMDKTVSGLYVNVKNGKDGEFSGDLIDLETLGKLKNQVDHLLQEMATALQTGIVPILPANGSNYQYTCDYCDYRSVCGFENGSPVRDIPSFPLKDAIQKLNEEGEETHGEKKMDNGAK